MHPQLTVIPQNASELCVQLVDDIYGELTSVSALGCQTATSEAEIRHLSGIKTIINNIKRIFKILLRYGRLSIPALHYHTGLSPRLIKHGLSVLVQQQLVVWYTYAEEPTVYEANTEAAYFLIRSGKYVKIAEDQIDEFAGAVISNLLLLGHAKVGDLVKAYGVSSRKDVNGPTTATHGVANKPLANDVNNTKDHVGDNAVTLETIHNTLCDLLRLGLVSHVNESHFRSDADNRLEAQKVVPPPEYYKAKSKKENEAQWEASIQNKLEEWMFGTEAEIEDVEILRKGGKRLLEDPESSRAGKRQRLHSDRSNEIISATGTDYKSKTVDKGFLDVWKSEDSPSNASADFL